VEKTDGDIDGELTAPQLLRFVRVHFGEYRQMSVAKALIRKWGLREAEVMIRGAHLLGWQSLLSLNASEGIGRRWATAKYWDAKKTAVTFPEAVKVTLRAMLT
jgi:hypothetical protein